MSDLQLTWTERELLADHDVAEPLVAGGVRCHGGFDADGAYVSPRTRNRVPAIEAWQQSHREQFGTELLDAPLELWPEVYPNVAQSKYLLREGVREPTISTLTRIGTVEGFGVDDPRGARSTTCSRTSTSASPAPRSRTCSAGCSRRTRATKPAGRTKAATSRCGSRRATSRSSTRSPRT